MLLLMKSRGPRNRNRVVLPLSSPLRKQKRLPMKPSFLNRAPLLHLHRAAPLSHMDTSQELELILSGHRGRLLGSRTYARLLSCNSSRNHQGEIQRPVLGKRWKNSLRRRMSVRPGGNDLPRSHRRQRMLTFLNPTLLRRRNLQRLPNAHNLHRLLHYRLDQRPLAERPRQCHKKRLFLHIASEKEEPKLTKGATMRLRTRRFRLP